MENRSEFFSRIRLVYKRSSTVTKVLVLCAVVLSTVALTGLHLAIADAQAQTEAIRNHAAQLEQENQRLEQKIDALGSMESVEQIARDELGLADPDSVIFQPQN